MDPEGVYNTEPSVRRDAWKACRSKEHGGVFPFLGDFECIKDPDDVWAAQNGMWDHSVKGDVQCKFCLIKHAIYRKKPPMLDRYTGVY